MNPSLFDTIGLYLGAGLSSLSTLIADKYGWTAAFRIVGLSGIVVAIIFEFSVDLRCLCFLSRSSTPLSVYFLYIPTNPLISPKFDVIPSPHHIRDRPLVGTNVNGDDRSNLVPTATVGRRDERCPLLSGKASSSPLQDNAATTPRKITVIGSHSGTFSGSNHGSTSSSFTGGGGGGTAGGGGVSSNNGGSSGGISNNGESQGGLIQSSIIGTGAVFPSSQSKNANALLLGSSSSSSSHQRYDGGNSQFNRSIQPSNTPSRTPPLEHNPLESSFIDVYYDIHDKTSTHSLSNTKTPTTHPHPPANQLSIPSILFYLTNPLTNPSNLLSPLSPALSPILYPYPFP